MIHRLSQARSKGLLVTLTCLLVISTMLGGCSSGPSYAPPSKATWQLSTLVVEGQGSISPSGGTFSDGAVITLTAFPASGWSFSHWGYHGSESQNPITITMDSNKTVYAYFTRIGATPTATYVPIPTETPLPRSPWGHPEIMKLYITPDDPAIQAAVDDILSGYWRWAYSDFEAMRQWVSTHISYVYDIDSHGISEYWQLPAETLSLGTGDCEDFAILLCTLLRAYGVPADEVYVGGGWSESSNIGHAFLFEHWYEGNWRAVEPQLDVWWVFVLGDIDISGYDEFWCFNDQEYFSGKPTLPLGVYEFEVGYSFWPATRGASAEFERYLSSGQSVTGSVEWHGSSAITYDWSFTVYDQHDNVVLTWSGTDLRHDFSFTPLEAGIYKLEVLKRDYLARCARMEIQPSDWTQR